MPQKTEDMVRDEARAFLNFHTTPSAQCSVGQLTTFNQLGFPGVPDKPDGWYLPDNPADVAIILETKNYDIDITRSSCVAELFKNVDIAMTKYKRVIGILYNGKDVLVYKDKVLIDLKKQLFTKEYYLKLYNKNTIDKSQIFELTEKINNNLHTNFGVNNLYHRMIFTACALVAQRYKANCLLRGMDWATLHTSILSTINKSYEAAKVQNIKLSLLGEQFSLIQCNYTENQDAIDAFIECINKISSSINSDYWNGEDVMAIFFNEFTRYKGKSEQGQVFTPDHITSLIYRITGTSFKDNVLDACCGSGSFLTKAMSYMISEVGGSMNEPAVKEIKEKRLYGVEFSKELYALACANMLIHKDGKTNLTQDDSRTESAAKWIKSKNITKALMNPPYETKFGCLTIVENVLNSVRDGAICAFILPDNKLTSQKGFAKKLFAKHTLQKIIKLPDVFAGMAGVTTSIFIFKAHEAQAGKEVFSCWIKDDGLETVKNKGRMDTKNRWQALEDKWVEIIYKQSGDSSIQWLKPDEGLAYKVPTEARQLLELDFKKTVLAHFLFNNRDKTSHIVVKEQNGVLLSNSAALLKFLGNVGCEVNTTLWQSFPILDLFYLKKGKRLTKQEMTEGTTPFVGATAFNNGVTQYVGQAPNQEGGSISVCYNGSVGESFYQAMPYWASDDVNVLYPKGFAINSQLGLALATIIRTKAQDSYGYTHKWNLARMEKDALLLPAKDGKPDFEWLERYVLALSSRLAGLDWS